MTLADRLPAYTWDRIAPLGEKAGLHPDGAVDLSVGTPVDPVPAVIRTALAEASDAPGYPLTRGTERLRSAAAGWLERAHQVRVSPDDVLPVIGTKEFIAWLPVMLGLGPGDVLVHPALAYPTYDIGARLAGASAIASDSLLAAGPSRVRLVWLNSPSNPTGRVLPAEHLRKVVAWAAERGAVVASDECYIGLGWEVSPVSVLHPSVRGGSHAGLLAVHSLSKRSNLAGYRAGFVTGDPALVAQLLAIRKQAGMMVPAPVQAAMTAALSDDAHAVAQRERYAARRSLLRGAFTGAGWTIDHSEAGLYLWVAHPDHDCWSAAELLAAQCGILVAPGELYGPSGARHIRVALTATDERVAAGVRRLAALDALCPPNRGHNPANWYRPDSVSLGGGVAGHQGRVYMLRTFHARAAFTAAAAGAAMVLGAGSALAVGGWTVVAAPPTGQNATLTGVATVSDSDAWAVGFTGGHAFTNIGAKVLIDNWNGTAWTQVATPATPQNTALLNAVSTSGASDAWAVGRTQNNKSNFAGLALHWNGTAWSVSPSFTGALGVTVSTGVADISPTDAYAVGNNFTIPRGHLAHWDGTTWSSVTVPVPPDAPTNTTLDAISADGPNDAWAVGTFLNSATGQFNNFTIHFNGTAWAVVPMPVSGTFSGIKANSPTDVWAVGTQGAGSNGSATLIAHFNGTAWSAVPSPTLGQRASLTGVTTSNAANNVWAVGSFTPAGSISQQTLTLNWNGTAWSVVASPNPASTDGVGAVATNPGAAIVWAVGESGPAGSFNPLVLQNG
jgi:succinyldiaminopimelate transaminase